MWSIILLPLQHLTCISWSIINLILISTYCTTSRHNEHSGAKVIGNNSTHEDSLLLEFRRMVSDVLEKRYERTDQFLLRWIRASQFDLDVAEQMIRKAQQWRKDYKMDSILNETPLETGNKIKDHCNINGIAYDGTPVTFVRVTQYDIRLIMRRGLKSNITRQFNQCLERLSVKSRNLSETTGQNIDNRVTVIIDAKGFNLKEHGCPECRTLYRELIRDIQNYFPEFFRLLVLLNVPRILKPLLEIARPMFGSSILNIVHIFGSDTKESSSFLLKHIPASQLSGRYGGTAPW